jgi:hypothetical protein
MARASGRDMATKKPHQIADDEIGSRGATTIGLILVSSASEAEFEAEILMKVLQTTGTFLRRGVDRSCWDGEAEARMKPVVGKKRRDASGGVARVVIGKLRHGEKGKPIILLVTYDAPQVLFKDLIYPLSLAICLGMMGCRQLCCSAEDLKESSPEMGDKLWTPIGDNILRQAV